MTDQEIDDLAMQCIEVALDNQGVSFDIFTEAAKANAKMGAVNLIRALIQLGYRLEREQ